MSDTGRGNRKVLKKPLNPVVAHRRYGAGSLRLTNLRQQRKQSWSLGSKLLMG